MSMRKNHQTEKNPSQQPRGASRGPFSPWSAALSVLLAAAVGFCLIVTVQIVSRGYASFFGYSAFRVVTGSMEPTLGIGEALICRRTPIEQIKAGDIICYLSDAGQTRGAVITHRVIALSEDDMGQPLLTTRGDANLVSDADPVSADALIGRVVWHSGKERFFTDTLSFFTGKIGFLACIVFPVLLIVGLILQHSVKGLYEEIRRVRLAAQNDPDAPLPGYTTLTRRDYDEIFNTLKEELTKELSQHAAKPEEIHANAAAKDAGAPAEKTGEAPAKHSATTE